jgi:hypothetical protein
MLGSQLIDSKELIPQYSLTANGARQGYKISATPAEIFIVIDQRFIFVPV